MKKISAVMLCLVLAFMLSACAEPETEAPNSSGKSQNLTVVIDEIIDDSTLLAEIIDMPWEQLTIETKNITDGSTPNVNDAYEIEYRGEMKKTSPMHIETIISMVRVSTDTLKLHYDAFGNLLYGIELEVPDGWEYKEDSFNNKESQTLCVKLNPKGKDGCVSIEVRNAFGTCGTGLEEKTIDFNGHKALQGFYDGNKNWDFISLCDDYYGCVILNQSDGWFDDYSDDIEQILSGISFI